MTAGVALLMQEHWRNRHASAGGDPGLPSVDHVEKWMRDGGVRFQDVDDTVAKAMDNVKSSGASFIRLNALGAAPGRPNVCYVEPPQPSDGINQETERTAGHPSEGQN